MRRGWVERGVCLLLVPDGDAEPVRALSRVRLAHEDRTCFSFARDSMKPLRLS